MLILTTFTPFQMFSFPGKESLFWRLSGSQELLHSNKRCFYHTGNYKGSRSCFRSLSQRPNIRKNILLGPLFPSGCQKPGAETKYVYLVLSQYLTVEAGRPFAALQKRCTISLIIRELLIKMSDISHPSNRQMLKNSPWGRRISSDWIAWPFRKATLAAEGNKTGRLKEKSRVVFSYKVRTHTCAMV